MATLKAIYSTFKIQLSSSLYRTVFVSCILIQPIFMVTLLYIMYHNGIRGNVGDKIVLGSGLTTIWNSVCFSSAGDIERERRGGTLGNLFATPTSFTFIYFGKVIANTLLSLNGFFISFFISVFVFKEIPNIISPVFFSMSFIVTILSFVSLSLVLGPIFTLSRNSRAFINSLDYPLYILCGLVVSLESLPSTVKPLCYVFPPTLAVELLRKSATEIIILSEFITKVVIILAYCLVYFGMGLFLQKAIDKKIRISASLEAV